eukprot:9471258-Pyramimonas_sp.AAC.1
MAQLRPQRTRNSQLTTTGALLFVMPLAQRLWLRTLGITEASVTNKWRVGTGLLNPPSPPLEEATKDSIMNAMQTLCTTHGGPRNYLQKMYPGKRERVDFANAIMKLLPMSQDTTYHLGGAMPVDTFNLHLSYFSFHDLASKKAPPGEALTMELVDQYLTDGFRTIGDPIKVSRDCLSNDFIGSFEPSWPTPGVEFPLKVQSVMYVKGQARVLTALALVSLLIEDGVQAEKLLEATCQQKGPTVS